MGEVFERLQVTASARDGRVEVEVRGEIDLASVDVLRSVLDEAVAARQGDIEIDLAAVTFCDSVGLSTLAAARRQLSDAGRTLRIVKASSEVQRLLELSGTRAYFGGPDPVVAPAP